MKNKGILVVSFGSTHQDTRERTIYQIEKEIQDRFKDYQVYRAFTSKVIIKILRNRDGIEIFTVTEALKKMQADGITEVIVQPTHIINGIENDLMIKELKDYQSKFETIAIGTPLLHTTDDHRLVMEGLAREVHLGDEKEAVVLMGHGTSHYSNTAYAAFEYMMKNSGYENVYIATVEAYPGIETVINQLRKKVYKRVTLLPFMIVAGDHAINDMAGEEEDSFKCMLLQEGYEVNCILRGLGEYPSIRSIFLKHIEDATLI